MSTPPPAVPVPAGRSGEDHAAARRFAADLRNLALAYEAYASILSRDSGEVVRRAQAWPGDDLRQDVLLANGTDLAADVLSLSASAARLKTDINDAQAKIVHLGKMAKRECERADDLEASAARLTEERDALRARLTEDNKRLREALAEYGSHPAECGLKLGRVCNCEYGAILRVSPTASPPEGQTRTPEQSIADAVNNPSIKAQAKRMEADKGPEWKA